jgi:signal transduction histidine kinase
MDPSVQPRSRLPLPGGASGEMITRVQEKEWSGTALGPVEEWPEALCMAVAICLPSRFPMCVFWGPELVGIHNDAFAPILGARHPGALGLPIRDVWPEVWEEVRPQFEAVLGRGESTWNERVPMVVERNGYPETVHFTWSYSPLPDGVGGVGGLLCTVQEETGRVQAELALAESQRRLDSALIAGEVGTFEWQIRDDRLFGDRNFASIFGIRLDDSGAAPLADYLAAIHPSDRAAVEARVEQALATGADYEAEYRIVSGAETRWVIARGKIEVDATGVPDRFPGVVLDVSARKRAEEERERLLRDAQEARRDAEAANRAKADFLAAMSHDLRTPLNAIGGYVELLELGVHGPVTSDQEETLARIAANQRHLLTLISDILQFAQVEAGRVQFDLRPLVVRDLLRSLEALVGPSADARGVAYSATDCATELRVMGDEERVRQILLNLVGNATKFTPPGGWVLLSCAAEEAWVLFRIRDNGPGIALEKQQTIFDPFVQVDRRLNRPLEGVGLGLAISRDLARAMGGELEVESAPGEGSTFTLRLPRAG